jgi:hypothetical protein
MKRIKPSIKKQIGLALTQEAARHNLFSIHNNRLYDPEQFKNDFKKRLFAILENRK